MSNDQLPRLGLFMSAPLLALVLIAVNAIGQVVDANQRVLTGQALNTFASQGAETLDLLQGERANAAVALRNAQPATLQQYRQYWQRTDTRIADLMGPEADARGLRLSQSTRDKLALELAGLDDLRTAIVEDAITLQDGMKAYGAVIDGVIEALAAEFQSREGSSANFAEAFLLVAKLHERVAVEAGTGLTTFYSGRIDREAHELFISAVAPQEMLASRFSALAGPRWREALDQTLAGAPEPTLREARNAIIQAGYRPDGAVDPSYRTWWRETRLPVFFALGELRNQFAAEGLLSDIRSAREQRARTTRNALLQILAMFVATAASIYGLATFVRPDDQTART